MALLLAVSCAPAPHPTRRYVVEKAGFQALYAADGTLERLVADADGDRRAETSLFYAGGRLRRAEVDDDGDGVVERWEEYGLDGRVEKLGTSSSDSGKPDVWTWSDGRGGLTRRESDLTGDGRPDLVETFEDGRPLLQEFDTDQDGRLDRRLLLGPDGVPSGIEVDTDGDGTWEAAPLRRAGPGPR